MELTQIEFISDEEILSIKEEPKVSIHNGDGEQGSIVRKWSKFKQFDRDNIGSNFT